MRRGGVERGCEWSVSVSVSVSGVGVGWEWSWGWGWGGGWAALGYHGVGSDDVV